MNKGIPSRSYKESCNRKATNRERITSGVLQGSVLIPLLVLMYVNDICRNIKSMLRFFTDACIMHMKIINNKDMATSQI
jgi:hypothetical protein